MVINFKTFMEGLIVENLHPEIHSIVTSKTSHKAKQVQLANKIKDLSSRGEKTGIEGNMPKGSSRAYLKHDSSHKINLDNKPATIPIGTKVAIKAALDNHHDHKKHDGMGLGALQNQAEGGDHWVNNSYRVITPHPNGKEGHFVSNHHHGIFPPLIDHDHDNHEWTKVGHSHDMKASDFPKHTKTKDHPQGITHKDFTDSLERNHDRQNGKYWEKGDDHEKHLDHVDEHPLVQKFTDYHNNTGAPPHDYRSIKNMGVFHHPDGPKHIVARDHGFSTEVANAYKNARRHAAEKRLGLI
jgi:hypothetical protein